MAHTPASPERFGGHVFAQRLPEVAEVVPGAPAPWAQLSPLARRGLTLDTVLGRLEASGRVGATPEEVVELTGVDPAVRGAISRRSAVLVALFEREGETEVVLTRRSFELRHHRGEIALPGGRSDPGESTWDTATREAREEVGLDPTALTSAGWLTPIATFASGSAIWPVVGTLAAAPLLVPDPAEVERAFTVPLADLAADGAFVEERWRRDERRPGVDEHGYVAISFFKVPGDLIWGATARVLNELVCVALDVAWPGRIGA